MKIYYQLTDNNDNELTSTQAEIESKLFATAVPEKGETADDLDMDSLRSQAKAKCREIEKNSNLQVRFVEKSEYTSQKGNRGLFFVVPDII